MAWNALPDDLQDPSLSADNFRKTLKTHLFRNALGRLAKLEALLNALYKFKTYLLTYLQYLLVNSFTYLVLLVIQNLQQQFHLLALTVMTEQLRQTDPESNKNIT